MSWVFAGRVCSWLLCCWMSSVVTCTQGACICSGEKRTLDVIFGREVFFGTLLVERFSCVLSAGIHGWILPWPRGSLSNSLGREVFLSYFRQGFTWVNSSLVERFSFELSWARGFSFVLSAGIHLGEFFLDREVFFHTLRRDSLGWILPWPRGFLLNSLGREVFFHTLGRHSLGWILPWPRGFFRTLLAKRFSFILSTGIHLSDFFLGREVFFELSWPRGFLSNSLGREVFLSYSRQGFTWVNSSLAERFSSNSLGREVFLLNSLQGFTWVNSSLAERFFFWTFGKDSLGWILPWPRGFLRTLLAKRFSSNSLGREVFLFNSLGRDSLGWILLWPRGFLRTLLSERFFFRTLDRDSLGWILPWPRSFSFVLSVGIHLGEFFLG